MRYGLAFFLAVVGFLLPTSSGEGRHGLGRRHKRVDLTIMGHVRTKDGEGRQATDLMEILGKTTSMSFVPIRKISPKELKLVRSNIRKILTKSGVKYPGRVFIHEHMLTCPPRNQIPTGDYWAQYKLPERNDRQVRLAYTMYESSRAPGDWAYILNNSYDAAIVPDEFLVKVYKDSGVTIPIFVIPLGRDFSKLLATPLKAARGTPFVFANFSALNGRKNIMKLVQAFSDTFGNSSDVQLRLGWRWADKGATDRLMELIASLGLTNVIVEQKSVDAEAYYKRFLMVDCYVNIATGEGFSIQPREAMALGIPVIVTDNTAQSTICASGLVRTVRSTIEIPALYPFPGNFGVQYDCRTKDVVAALRDVYYHYDTYLAKAPAARQWASAYHFTKMAPLYKSFIRPKNILLGEEDQVLADGTIVTTSERLIQKYRTAFARRR